jgi:hypothetical protein
MSNWWLTACMQQYGGSCMSERKVYLRVKDFKKAEHLLMNIAQVTCAQPSVMSTLLM